MTACKDFIDNLQAIITEYMKTTGFSVGISDLIADDETNSNIDEIIVNKKKEVANLIDQEYILEYSRTKQENKSNEEQFESQVNNILNKASMEAGNGNQ